MTGRAGAGPKLRDGDTGLILERGAQRHLELLGEFLAGEHRRGLIHVELTSGIGADRRDFLEVKIRIDAQSIGSLTSGRDRTSVRRVE